MSRNIQRRDVLKGMGAAGLTASVAGCIGGITGGPRALQQGVLLPTSGGLADLGVPIKNAAVMPLDQLEGETDFTIDRSVKDTQTDANAARSAAQDLSNAGYPAVTGAASSEVSISVYENVFIPNGIVGCSPASTSPAISDLEDNNLIWRTPPTDALQGQVLAQVATDRLDASTASTMHVNNSYGQLLSESFATSFREEGGTVQTQVSFEKAQSSYTSRLEQALSDDPDTMIVIGYPDSGVQLFRDFYSDFDSDIPILVTDGLRSSSLPTNVGNAMSNVTGTAPLAAGPGREFFVQEYQNQYGNEPGVFTAQAFDATAVCLLANAKAGENTGSAIASEMANVANPGSNKTTYQPSELADAIAAAANGEAIEYVGASSAVDFDEQGDLKAATYEYFGFQEGGGIETIDTIAFSA